MCVLRLEFLKVPRSGAQSAIPGNSDVCHKTLACFLFFERYILVVPTIRSECAVFCAMLQFCYHDDSLIDRLDHDPVVQCLVSHHKVFIACSFRVCFPGRRVKAYE